MDSRKWIKCIRLFLGFLLAPAVVPVWLGLSLFVEMWIDPSWGDNGAAFAMFASLLVIYGAKLAYLGTFLFGLPCALVMLDKGRLNFVNVMVATGLLALMYCLALNVILSRLYTFVPNVVAWSVPAVIVSGLCFYLISVWRPCKKTGNQTPPVACAGRATM